MIGVSFIVWAAVMGLNALFVGTLSDERRHKIDELHDAYLGVVEVLAQYLKSADPRMYDESKRITIISQDVARRMLLSEQETDDIRVAALLQDVDNIEVTARVIHRAVDELQNSQDLDSSTFKGGDLVLSLGRMLKSALPLLVSRKGGSTVPFNSYVEQRDEPIGAAIIRTVRKYDALTSRADHPLAPLEAIKSMQVQSDGNYNSSVLSVLEQLTQNPSRAVVERIQSIENLICHNE